MGKTFAQKVLGRAAGKDVVPGDIVIVEPDFCLSHENSSAVCRTFEKIGIKKVWNPDKIVIVFDHTVPSSTEDYANAQKLSREFMHAQGIKNFYDLNNFGGICHQIMSQEGYALPGSIIVGTDSHTCTSGAMGAFATGLGRSETAAVWALGTVWLMVPETIRINVEGTLQKGVAAKDFILKVIGDLKADGADYKSVEFHGPGIEKLSIAERMTICNMGIEMGAKNAVCKPDEKVIAYAKAHAKRSGWEPVWADPDAHYVAEFNYNLNDIVPSVAKPYKVDNYARVTEVQGTKIDQAFLGACTNARLEDLRAAAEILDGKKVKVRMVVIPASCKVYQDAIEEGIITVFLKSGCTISHPTCGPCVGVSGGILAQGEVCISTANRNFQGRMGARDSQVYLASPATVAYSALCGEIRDPREAF